MILPNTPSWYFHQYHQRYSLQYATHVSTPLPLATLAHHPRYPRWDVTHTSTSPTLACYPRQHATNANKPPTLVHATYDTHICTKSMPFLKPQVSNSLSNSKRKFSSFLLLVFIYTTAFTFQALISIFTKVSKTVTEKLN